jgi:hypothetical protein
MARLSLASAGLQPRPGAASITALNSVAARLDRAIDARQQLRLIMAAAHTES